MPSNGLSRENHCEAVSAYVSNDAVPLSDVGDLIGIVHNSFIDINSSRENILARDLYGRSVRELTDGDQAVPISEAIVTSTAHESSSSGV